MKEDEDAMLDDHAHYAALYLQKYARSRAMMARMYISRFAEPKCEARTRRIPKATHNRRPKCVA